MYNDNRGCFVFLLFDNLTAMGILLIRELEREMNKPRVDNFVRHNEVDYPISNKQIIDGFIGTELFENFKLGWPFLRAITIYLSQYYPTNQLFSEEEIDSLWEETKSRNLL